MLKIVGAIVAAVGVIWIAQGLGVLRWPPESFMIDQRAWIGWGVALAFVGLGLLAAGRKP